MQCYTLGWVAAAAAVLSGSGLAQSLLPVPTTGGTATGDLNATTPFPFGSSQCRVQFWYGAEELPLSAFTALALSLRYDGPVPPAGNAGPHAIQRVRIRIGTSQTTQPGASFEHHLTQPLTEVFDGAWSYFLDPSSVGPTPFGAPQGTLRWTLAQPTAVVLPAGSWFVVEFVIEGNLGAGMGHAALDAYRGTGAPVNGTAVSRGIGCAVPGALASATIATFGSYAPGAAYALHGTNLGSGAGILTSISLSDQVGIGALPLQIPGSSCWIHTGFDVLQLRLANANGTLVGTLPGTWIAVPADPAFNSLQLFHQHLAIHPGANPSGIIASNYRAVTLGDAATPNVRLWLAGNDIEANSEAANVVQVAAPALQLEVQ